MRRCARSSAALSERHPALPGNCWQRLEPGVPVVSSFTGEDPGSLDYSVNVIMPSNAVDPDDHNFHFLLSKVCIQRPANQVSCRTRRWPASIRVRRLQSSLPQIMSYFKISNNMPAISLAPELALIMHNALTGRGFLPPSRYGDWDPERSRGAGTSRDSPGDCGVFQE